MPAGRTTLAVVVAGFALVTAACGSTQQNAGSSGTTTTTPPSSTSASQGTASPAKVKFAGDVCGAIQQFMTPATSFKPDTSSPAAAMNSLKTQLGAMSTGLDKAVKDLDDVDASGVPDGQAAVTELKKTFSQLKQAVDTTKPKLDGVDPNNPQAIAAAVQAVSKDLSAMGSNMQNPLDQPALKSADMEAAAEQAPECQKIKTQMGGSASGSGTSTPTSR
jgi:hypothetical protein